LSRNVGKDYHSTLGNMQEGPRSLQQHGGSLKFRRNLSPSSELLIKIYQRFRKGWYLQLNFLVEI
jgi:hypothetical protein